MRWSWCGCCAAAGEPVAAEVPVAGGESDFGEQGVGLRAKLIAAVLPSFP